MLLFLLLEALKHRVYHVMFSLSHDIGQHCLCRSGDLKRCGCLSHEAQCLSAKRTTWPAVSRVHIRMHPLDLLADEFTSRIRINIFIRLWAQGGHFFVVLQLLRIQQGKASVYTPRYYRCAPVVQAPIPAASALNCLFARIVFCSVVYHCDVNLHVNLQTCTAQTALTG